MGFETAVGANAGSICYGLVSAAGLSLVLQRFPGAWAAIRYAGIAYIGWLGVQSLRRALDREGKPLRAVSSGDAPHGALARVREGFLTNTLNPAIATFYLAIVPQFVPPGEAVARSILTLTAIHVALAFSWHASWAAAGGTLSHVLTRPPARQLLEAAAGTALLALAISLLFR